MSRLQIPAVSDAPAASQPLLDAVHKKLGVVPNMMKLLGQSPAALEGRVMTGPGFPRACCKLTFAGKALAPKLGLLAPPRPRNSGHEPSLATNGFRAPPAAALGGFGDGWPSPAKRSCANT